MAENKNKVVWEATLDFSTFKKQITQVKEELKRDLMKMQIELEGISRSSSKGKSAQAAGFEKLSSSLATSVKKEAETRIQGVHEDNKEKKEQNKELKKSIHVFDAAAKKFARQQGLIGALNKEVSKSAIKEFEKIKKTKTKEFDKLRTSQIEGVKKNISQEVQKKTDPIIKQTKEAVLAQKMVPKQIKELLEEQKKEVKRKPPPKKPAPKKPTTSKTDALLTRIASLVTNIDKKVKDSSIASKVNNQSSFKAFSQRAGLHDPAREKQALKAQFDQVIPLMRLQGSRKGESINEGGIKNVLTRFPELQSSAGTNNRKLQDLQNDLSKSIKDLIENGDLVKLNEIASYMVRSWGKLARTPANQRRQNPLPDMGIPTAQINKNWTKTQEHISSQLDIVVKDSKKQGHEIQRNVSEGSPGITQKIREYWKKTSDYVGERMGDMKDTAGDFGTTAKQKFSDVIKTLKAVGTAGVVGIGAIFLSVTGLGDLIANVVGSSLSKISELVDSSLTAARNAESLKISYDFIFGQANSGKVLSQLAAQTNALGLSVSQAKKDFGGFAIALQDTGLEDSALDITHNLQKVTSIIGGSDAQNQAITRALTQMLGKSTVLAEELTGQLGEAMPQALAAGSKAMNMSKQELLAYMKTGRLLATEFVPKLTSALGRQADIFLQTAPEPLDAKMQKLENTYGAISIQLGKGTVEMMKPLIDGLNLGLTLLLKFKDEIVAFGASIGAVLLSPIISNALKGFVTIKNFAVTQISQISTFIKTEILKTEATATKSTFKFGKALMGVLSGIKAAMRAILPFFASFAAFEVLSGASQFMNVPEKARADLAKRRASIVAGGSGSGGGGGGSSGGNIGAPKTGNFVFDFVDAIYNRPLQNMGTGKRTMADLYQQRRVGQSREELTALQDTTRTLIENVARKGGVEKYIERLATLEKEFEDNAAAINSLRSNNTAAAKEEANLLQKTNVQVQSRIDKLNKEFFAFSDFGVELDKTNEKITNLKEIIAETGDPTGELTRQLTEAQVQAKSLSSISSTISEGIKHFKNNLFDLNKALSSIEIDERIKRFSAESESIQARTNVLGRAASQGRGLTMGENVELAQIAQTASLREVDILEESIKRAKEVIAQTLDSSTSKSLVLLLNSLGANIEDLSEASYEALLKVQNQTDLEGNLKSIVDQLVAQKEKEQGLLQAQERYNQSAINTISQQRQNIQTLRSYSRSLQDLETTIQDYYRNQSRRIEDFDRQIEALTRQFQQENKNFVESYRSLSKSMSDQIRELTVEVGQIAEEVINAKLLNDAREALGGQGESLFTGFIELTEGLFASELEAQNRQLTLEEERLQAEERSLDISRQIEGINLQRLEMERSRKEMAENLIRQQEDFQLQQAQSWRQITRQVEDMRSQAEQMGITFTSIADTIKEVAQKLEEAKNQLASGSGGSFAVGPGQLMGLLGSTGHSTGPHIHMEAKDASGNRIDPLPYRKLFSVGGQSLADQPITSHMGMRTLNGKTAYHGGVDIAGGSAVLGSKIKFLGQGKFTPARRVGGYGFQSQIELEDGVVITLSHLLQKSTQIADVLTKAEPVKAPVAVKPVSVAHSAVPQVNREALERKHDHIEELEARRQSLAEEREAQKLRTTQLNNQRSINNAIQQTKAQLQQLRDEYSSILETVQGLQIEAKGTLSYEEQREQIVKETAQRYQDIQTQIQDSRIAIEQLLEVEDAQGRVKSFDALVERMSKMTTLTEAQKEQVKLFRNLLEEGTLDLEKISELYQQLEVDALSATNKIGEQLTKENLFDQQMKKADILAENYRLIGEGIAESNPFTSSRYSQIAAEIDLLAEYEERFKAIETAMVEFAGDEDMISRLQNIRGELESLREDELTKLPAEFNTYAQAIGQPIGDLFRSLLTDFAQGQATLGDLFLGLLSQVSNFLTDLAAQMFQSQIMNWLGGLFGGSLGGGLGAIAPAPSFSRGGKIQSFPLGMSLLAGMKNEGRGAVPIVGHVGEWMLSSKNGDAQLYEQLRKSGQWDRMKTGTQNSYSIPVYSSPMKNQSDVYSNSSSNNNPVYNSYFNIQTDNAESFNRSRSQLAQQERLKRERAERYQ